MTWIPGSIPGGWSKETPGWCGCQREGQGKDPELGLPGSVQGWGGLGLSLSYARLPCKVMPPPCTTVFSAVKRIEDETRCSKVTINAPNQHWAKQLTSFL